MELHERLKQKFSVLFTYLDERQRRVAAALEARSLGHGRVTAVAKATGLSRPSIHKGLGELSRRQPGVPLGRSRKVGAGRKPLGQRDPKIVEELDRLVDPDTRGDPMSPLRWTCKSTRQLAQALMEAGRPVSHRVVGELLGSMGYSLQANVKTKEGKSHPDRDAQFRYLNEQVRNFSDQGRTCDQRRYQEEGTDRRVQEWRGGMATTRGAGARTGTRFRQGKRDSPWSVRRREELGLGHCRLRSRHRHFCRRQHPPLVAGDGTGDVSERLAVADLR